MAQNFVEWQPLICLKGLDDTPVIQPSEDWLDFGDAREAFIRVDLKQVGATGCTLFLQTAPTTAGPWGNVGTYTSVNVVTDVLGNEAGVDRVLARYLRWSIQGPADTWFCTFELSARVPADNTQPRFDNRRLPQKDRARVASAQPPLQPHRVEDGPELQPWTFLVGGFTASSDKLVIASEENWLDTRGLDKVFVEVEALDLATLAGVSLVLETAMSMEGPWTSVLTLTTPGVSTVVLSSEDGATAATEEFLRWHLTSTSDNWTACFRISARAPRRNWGLGSR